MKLSTRLTLILLVLSLAPVIVVGYIGYDKGRQNIQQNTFNRLTSTNILKEAEFNRWIQANRLYIRAMAQRPLVRKFSAILCNGDLQVLDSAPIHTQILNDHLIPGIEGSMGFVTFSVLRASDGFIVVSTNALLENKYRENTPWFIAGKHDTYVDDVTYSLSLEELVMHISTPIIDAQGKLIAVLAGHVDWHEMSAIMLQRSGLSASEESYLVNEFNHFVTESRFRPGAALRKTIHTIGVQACLGGAVGVDLYNNYRGIEVIGAYRWNPRWNLCIITEEDQSEAFAPVMAFRNAVFGVGGGLILLVAVIGIMFAHTSYQRINRLVEGAQEIGGGNLHHRILIKRQDELGALAKAFNAMARSRQEAETIIQQSHDRLESRVVERTAELEEANRKLSDQIIERTQAEMKLQQSLNEKEVLLREIHHRVKNNLQMVQSLINLQANKLKSAEFLAAFTDANARIKSMALIHETLYRSEDLAQLDLETYFNQLTRYLRKVYLPMNCRIETRFDIDPIRLDVDTCIACGLMVNELVTNALKYAFIGKPQGRLYIGLTHYRDRQMAELIVHDNGIGLPEDIDIGNTITLGLRIVTMLVEDQLNGTIQIFREHGTAFHLQFPIFGP